MIQIPTGSKCVVVGATNPSSIGFCAAKTLLEGGAKQVTIVGRDPTKLDAAVASLSQTVGKFSTKTIWGVLGDLKDPGSMAGVIEAAASKMGGNIDVLVCSGGNGYTEYLGVDVTDPESYRMVHDVTVLSPMFLTEAAVPYLSKSKNPGGGSVVVVGSVAASVPWPSTAPHNLATAAKNAMVETLAFKYRSANLRVNGVRVGIVHTGALDAMARAKGVSVEAYADKRASAQPLGRTGTPGEAAHAIAFLASPASAYSTGTFLTVDGGLHLTSWWNQPAMLKTKTAGGSQSQAGNGDKAEEFNGADRDGLEGIVISHTSAVPLAEQYNTFIEALIEYAGEKNPYLQDAIVTLEPIETMPTLAAPHKSEYTTADGEVDKALKAEVMNRYNEEYVEANVLVSNAEEELLAMRFTVWGQLSPSIQSDMADEPDFAQIWKDRDTLALLDLLRELCYRNGSG